MHNKWHSPLAPFCEVNTLMSTGQGVSKACCNCFRTLKPLKKVPRPSAPSMPSFPCCYIGLRILRAGHVARVLCVGTAANESAVLRDVCTTCK